MAFNISNGGSDSRSEIKRGKKRGPPPREKTQKKQQGNILGKDYQSTIVSEAEACPRRGGKRKSEGSSLLHTKGVVVENRGIKKRNFTYGEGNKGNRENYRAKREATNPSHLHIEKSTQKNWGVERETFQ